ncbi:MAG: hypothetical protein ACMUHB_05135, partial [Thermoplasmatota archaeon]
MTDNRGIFAGLILITLVLGGLPVLVTGEGRADTSVSTNVARTIPGSVELFIDLDPTSIAYQGLGGHFTLTIDDMTMTANPGEPAVPMDMIEVLIDPYGSHIRMEVLEESSIIIPAPGPIAGVPENIPISIPGEVEIRPYNVDIADTISFVRTGFIRGYQIASLKYTPVIPTGDGNIKVTTHIRFAVHFEIPSDQDL